MNYFQIHPLTPNFGSAMRFLISHANTVLNYQENINAIFKHYLNFPLIIDFNMFLDIESIAIIPA